MTTLAEFQRNYAQDLLEPGLGNYAGSAGYRIHARNVRISLSQAIADCFPVTAALVGESCFAAMAGAFVAAYPPRQGWLSGYGAAFPDFVSAYPPVCELAYLPDLARLEWARIAVMAAIDGPCLDLGLLATIEGDTLLATHLSLRSCAMVLTTRFPVIALWEAHQQADISTALARIDFSEQDRTMLVVRAGQKHVLAVELAPGDDAFMRAVACGKTLAVAWENAVRSSSTYDLAQSLPRLAATGAFDEIERKASAERVC